MKLSDTDFPRCVRERMEQVLLPGDEILWAERTVGSRFARLREDGNLYVLLFGLALETIMCIAFLGEFFSESSDIGNLLIIFLLAVFAFLGFVEPVNILFRSSECCMALTRHFFLRDQSGVLEAIALREDWKIRTESSKKKGAQNISFWRVGNTEADIELFHLSRASQLADALRTYLKEAPLEMMEPKRSVPLSEQLRPSESEQLRRFVGEEDMLWVGRSRFRGIGRPLPILFCLSLFGTAIVLLRLADESVDFLPIVCWMVWGICLLFFIVQKLRYRGRIYFLSRSVMGYSSPRKSEQHPLETVFLRRILADSHGIRRVELNRFTIQHCTRLPQLLCRLLPALQRIQLSCNREME